MVESAAMLTRKWKQPPFVGPNPAPSAEYGDCSSIGRVSRCGREGCRIVAGQSPLQHHPRAGEMGYLWKRPHFGNLPEDLGP